MDVFDLARNPVCREKLTYPPMVPSTPSGTRGHKPCLQTASKNDRAHGGASQHQISVDESEGSIPLANC